MKKRFRQWAILCQISAMTLIAGPAWTNEKSLTVMPPDECTLSAREVVDQFIDLLYRQKDVRLAFETWVHPDYIQHKPTLPDGREPVINFLEKLFERYPNRLFTIHRVISSNDVVAVHYHSQATPDDPGFAVVDIFRVENCRMVEHWDVVQPVPETAVNENTMF